METQEQTIATLNDEFRRGQSYILTQGVLGLDDVHGVIRAVRHFHDFTEDNNPYGEHDFGSIGFRGTTVCWKIDYYDQDLRGWCDPLSPACKRVLTIMLAEEY